MNRTYPEHPIVGVGAVIIHEGRALLVRRNTEPLKGEWSVPGGVLELGEKLAPPAKLWKKPDSASKSVKSSTSSTASFPTPMAAPNITSS